MQITRSEKVGEEWYEEGLKKKEVKGVENGTKKENANKGR